MTATRWVRRSLKQLQRELAKRGYKVSPPPISRLLREQKYSLRVNRKRLTGPPDPNREVQFLYLQEWMSLFALADWPIISVDTKKKELIGEFKNEGATWSRENDEVNVHDFPQDAQCRAVPYGIYDYLENRGHVVVGTSADTPAFAVDAIVDWWRSQGAKRYPGRTDLLILADSGGSNGCRPRLWKHRLQEKVADRFGLEVTVCHYPRGASKWNPVEHRLFGPISINWSGIPLRNLATLLSCLRGTRTETGLRVTAKLNLSSLELHYFPTCGGRRMKSIKLEVIL